MDAEKTKVAFFIERKRRYVPRGCGSTPGYAPREVTAVFVESGNYDMKNCYVHNEQHCTCSVEWVSDSLRPATIEEYKPLMDELEKQVGYNLEVIDAGWWIEKAMENFRTIMAYYSGTVNVA